VSIGFAAHVEADCSRRALSNARLDSEHAQLRLMLIDAGIVAYGGFKRQLCTAGLPVCCRKGSLHAALSSRQELHHRSDKLHRDGMGRLRYRSAGRK
jgi:hypothetical protein